MKFLVDAQLPRRLVYRLQEAGHEAIHTLDLPLGNRTPDRVISVSNLASPESAQLKCSTTLFRKEEYFMAPGITIVGLGPGGSQHWTQAAVTHLNQAKDIYLRTDFPPDLAQFSARLHHLTETLGLDDDLEQSFVQIASEIVRLGQEPAGVVFAVPGNPIVDEPTYPHIRRLAKARKLPLRLVPGLSRLEATQTALGLTGADSPQVVQAARIAALHHPPLDSDRPALVTHCHQVLASAVKQTLLNAYPADFEVILITAAGGDGEKRWTCPLTDLERQTGLDETTTLYLATNPVAGSFNAFQDVIAHLRAPEGCPWDREQTHQSLRPYLLEEAYEVLEALDGDDPTALAEELGDLLLQIVLHTQIAIDNNEFRMDDVIGHINRKMVRRHPHVFGQVRVNGSAEVIANWEAIKKAEKASKGENNQTPSVLDGVPVALPALAQALTISKRVVRVGFEWPDMEGVLDKLIEEAQEITEAPNAANLEAEVGDFLFSAVNLARWRNIDPESALRAMNARFTRRFKRVEALAAAQGKALPEMKIEEMETLWVEAKKREG